MEHKSLFFFILTHIPTLSSGKKVVFQNKHTFSPLDIIMKQCISKALLNRMENQNLASEL